MSASYQALSQPRVAVVGATGAVGIELIRCLEQRNFPLSSLRLLASKRSAGRTLPFRGREITVGVYEEWARKLRGKDKDWEGAVRVYEAGLKRLFMLPHALRHRGHSRRFRPAGTRGISGQPAVKALMIRQVA